MVTAGVSISKWAHYPVVLGAQGQGLLSTHVGWTSRPGAKLLFKCSRGLEVHVQTSLIWDVSHDGRIGRYGAASERKSGVFRVRGLRKGLRVVSDVFVGWQPLAEMDSC